MNLEHKLYSLINNEETGHRGFRDYSLKNIIALLKHYGDPHKKIKTIHISGTNGKGSVAHMLQSILISSGYRTGLYTSPHLLRINERIRINSKKITDKELNRYIDDLLNIMKNNDIKPTYFDVLTLCSFRYFYENQIDVAILETGLGGRLDSTNVVHPLISIITDISLDHINILGKTISEITYEKAGIIKKNSKIITSNIKPEILKIIDGISKKMYSKLFVFNRDFRVRNIKKIDNGFSFDFLSNKIANREFNIEDIRLKNICKFQIKNSSLAIASSLLLDDFNIQESGIKRGIFRTKIPGRFHMLSREPLIIFDPAHNPIALNAVIKAIEENYPGKRYIVIITFMKDKNYRSMYNRVKKFADDILYYELDDIRCFKPSSSDLLSFTNTEELYNALRRKIKKSTLILFIGTFRLYKISKKISTLLRNTK